MLTLQTVQVPPIPSVPMDPQTVAVLIFVGVVACVLILWPIARAIGRRLEGRPVADREVHEELEELRARLAQLEEGQLRVAELEERVEFAERLLAREPRPRQIES